METVENIITWYAEWWITNVPEFEDWSFLYAWLAGASAVTAVVTLIFVVFNREAGARSGALIGQQVLILGIPLIFGQLASMTGGGAEEGAMLLPNLLATATQVAAVLM